MEPTTFTARTTSGSARGGAKGVPTLNLKMRDIPPSMEEGIYACWVSIAGETFPGALHYGPRPVHDDARSCEVHIIDAAIEESPSSVEIELVARMRDVLDFASEEALYERIAEDIDAARAILGA